MRQKSVLMACLMFCVISLFGQKEQIYRETIDKSCIQRSGGQILPTGLFDVNGIMTAPQKEEFPQYPVSLRGGQKYQKLDSIIDCQYDEFHAEWGNLLKLTFLYNEDYSLFEDASYIWDSYSGCWTGGRMNRYAYYENGELDNYIYYHWVVDDSSWIKKRKYKYIYNNHKLIQYFRYDWEEETEKWEPYYKTDMTLNDQGYSVLEIRFIWNSGIEDWEEKYQNEFSHNDSGQVLSREYSVWDTLSDDWSSMIRTEFTYDTEQNTMEGIQYEWKEDLNDWGVSNREMQSFTEDGKVKESVGWYWEEAWIGDYREVYSYNTRDQVLLKQDYSWSRETEDWTDYTKTQYSYNEYDDLSGEEHFEWDEDLENWLSVYRYDYSHDEEFTFGNLILPFRFLDAGTLNLFNHQVTGAVLMVKEEDGETSRRKMDYYYTLEDHTSTRLTESGEIKLYPNPATTQVTIEFPENTGIASFCMYDLQGREVLSETLYASGSVSVEALDQGIYIYVIRGGENSASGRMVVE